MIKEQLIILLVIIIFIIWYLKSYNELFINTDNDANNNINKIIIPDIIGGLGNQLFIIASAFSFAKDNNYNLMLDDRRDVYSYGKPRPIYNDNVFIRLGVVNNSNNSIDLININESDFISMTDDIKNKINNKNVYLTGGYYQNALYFNKYRNELLDLLEPNDEINTKINEIIKLNNINLDKDFLIGVHIRLDDIYTPIDEDKRVYDNDEYNIILSKLPEHLNNNPNTKFIIFSNDIPRTRDIFSKITDTNINNSNMIYIQSEDYIELFLMAKCNEYIASPSTFNWWGIYLNKNIDNIKINIYWKQDTNYRKDFYNKYKYFKNLNNYFTLKNNLNYDMYNFITLGNECSPAAALRNLNIRNFALPFDWVVSSIDILDKCFKENFLKYHTNLKFNNTKTRLIDEYGFEFPHDYPTIDNKTIENKFIEEKLILEDWASSYDKVKEKYDRRIQRFIDILKDNKKIIILCRYSTNDVYRLYEILKKYYNKQNIMFANSCSEEFSNDFIKNCNTEKNGIWNDTTIWKETIDSLIYNDMKINNKPLFSCVSGYWKINNKHDNKFNNWFENTLAINCPYIFFTNEKNIDFINNYRKNYLTYYVKKNIEDFITYKLNIKNEIHEKHVPSKELGLVWLEKMNLILEASLINPYNSEWFCWIDAGVCVYRESKPSTNNFPNLEKMHLLSKTLINYSSSENLSNDKLYEIKNWNYLHNIAGTSFILHISIIKYIRDIFYKYLDICIKENNTFVCYSDQCIWTRIYVDYPELFNKVGDGYGQIILELN